MVQCVIRCSNHACSFELLPNVQDEFCFYIQFDKGENGECLSTKPHRSAPGGSGAGGSIVIITKTLHGNPHGRIFVQGGAPVKCAFCAEGGKSTVIYPVHLTHLNSRSVNGDVISISTTRRSMRSKPFCVVREQKKTKEREFRCFAPRQFLFIPHLSYRSKHQKSCSSVLLCSRIPRKRFLSRPTMMMLTTELPR